MDTSPRSLSAWLRTRSDEELAALLAARADLTVPVPRDVGALASRACVRLSVLRALERLDRFSLQLAEALCLLPETSSYDEVRGLVGTAAPDQSVRAGLDRLGSLALAWGADDALHLVAAVRELVTPYPAGLGRPVAVCLAGHSRQQLVPVLAALGLPAAPTQRAALDAIAGVFRTRDRLMSLLARAPDKAREALRELTAGPPLGTVPPAALHAAAGADTPVRWLLAHALLVAVDIDVVEMPREIGLALRGDQPLGRLDPEPPALCTERIGARAADEAAAVAAATATRAVESLLESWGSDPPPVLRAGGLGVRDLRRTAKDLDVPEPVAALYAETAYAAGLLDDSGGPTPVFLPTPAYDGWRRADTAQRWARLAHAWVRMPRLPGLVGRRDDRGKALAALGPDIGRAGAAQLREAVLLVLAELPVGTAATPDSLAELLGWRTPLHGTGLRDDVVRATLAEGAALGLTGRGALGTPGRRLLAGAASEAADALAPLLPDLLDAVLLQADLTAVAPGPLEPSLAREMALVADVESAGAATVFRISATSLRRAFDAGRTAGELHELFARHSRTPVPQALDYLIDDVARRHGVLRVGTATSFVRCEDPSLVAEVLVARKAAPLRLRRIAPTVLVSAAAVERVLEVLRDLGHAPVAESPDGAVVLVESGSRRTPARPHRQWFGPESPAPSDEQIRRAVAELRSGDRAALAAPRAPVSANGGGPGAGGHPGTGPGTGPGGHPGGRESSATTLALLHAAAREGRPVWLGYVNAQGQPSSRIVEPLSVGGGQLRAYDHRRENTVTFALHRVTGVADLEGGSPP